MQPRITLDCLTTSFSPSWGVFQIDCSTVCFCILYIKNHRLLFLLLPCANRFLIWSFNGILPAKNNILATGYCSLPLLCFSSHHKLCCDSFSHELQFWVSVSDNDDTHKHTQIFIIMIQSIKNQTMIAPLSVLYTVASHNVLFPIRTLLTQGHAPAHIIMPWQVLAMCHCHQ